MSSSYFPSFFFHVERGARTRARRRFQNSEKRTDKRTAAPTTAISHPQHRFSSTRLHRSRAEQCAKNPAIVADPTTHVNTEYSEKWSMLQHTCDWQGTNPIFDPRGSVCPHSRDRSWESEMNFGNNRIFERCLDCDVDFCPHHVDQSVEPERFPGLKKAKLFTSCGPLFPGLPPCTSCGQTCMLRVEYTDDRYLVCSVKHGDFEG